MVLINTFVVLISYMMNYVLNFKKLLWSFQLISFQHIFQIIGMNYQMLLWIPLICNHLKLNLTRFTLNLTYYNNSSMISMKMIIIKKRNSFLSKVIYVFNNSKTIFFQECGNNVQISEEISSLNSETYI